MGRWQRKETYLALDRNASDPDFPIIPMLLQRIEEPPSAHWLKLDAENRKILQAWQPADWSNFNTKRAKCQTCEVYKAAGSGVEAYERTDRR